MMEEIILKWVGGESVMQWWR